MTLDSVLEKLQDLSGVAFSSFLVLHLASPITAAFVQPTRSQSVASNIQLATRVIYQDGRTREALLVWIPLGTHIIVGIIRRITRINRQRRIRTQLEIQAQQAEPLPPSGRRIRGLVFEQTKLQWLASYLPRTLHAIAAYIGIPFLLDHTLSHRLSSSRSSSSRSFQYVGFKLQDSQILNFVKYGILVSSLVYHSLVGLDQVQSRLNHQRDRSGKVDKKSILLSQRSTSTRLAWLGIVGTVGYGIRKISLEPIPPWIARRYR